MTAPPVRPRRVDQPAVQAPQAFTERRSLGFAAQRSDTENIRNDVQIHGAILKL